MAAEGQKAFRSLGGHTTLNAGETFQTCQQGTPYFVSEYLVTP